MYPQRSVMTCGLATALEPPYFNHAPVRGATVLWQQHLGYVESFNPRTRVGCDGLSVRCRICYEVSIHAPAWGATPRIALLARQYAVSIHAPAWGATGAWIKGHARMSCFNPRTRVGCDLLLSVGFGGMEADVSIHAPAWGATNANESPFRLMKCFNSRTRVGCDEPDFDGWLERHGVSIHAPAWGATERLLDFARREDLVSIHAPAWGATSKTF